MYASLLISLLAAFVAMLGKQWLNRYLRHVGGSAIERCGDRQRKCDGLEKWPFHLFVESLPVMLQVSLLLLACGLCRHMWSINTSIASVLITLTALGILFYFGITIAGTSSYECPFQTPTSIALCSLWKNIGPPLTTALFSTIAIGISLYKTLLQSPVIKALHYPSSLSLPVEQHTPLEPTLQSSPLLTLWEDIQCQILCIALRFPQTSPLLTILEDSPIAINTSQWLEPVTLVTLQGTDAGDVRCVSWILKNITDPEALDAAIRLVVMIQWFEDGLHTEPPYDLIISTFLACFDSAGKVYPGLRDRALYSVRAILWIHIHAMCISEEFASRFPLPVIHHHLEILDDDLSGLLIICMGCDTNNFYQWLYRVSPRNTPVHLQWTSDAFLHLSWAKRNTPKVLHFTHFYIISRDWKYIPLNAALNHLLTWCGILGWPIEKEVLGIHDKSCNISYSHPPSCLLFLY